MLLVLRSCSTRQGRVGMFAIYRDGIYIIVGIMGYRFIAHRGGSQDLLVGILATRCQDRSGEGDGYQGVSMELFCLVCPGFLKTCNDEMSHGSAPSFQTSRDMHPCAPLIIL